MSVRYNIERAADGASYTFQTTSGITYFAYFTEFALLEADEQEVNVVSFGFTCDSFNPIQRHDTKVKQTIIHIVNEYFKSKPDAAVLYMCMNNDGKGRNRHVTFSRWFNESESELEKYDFASKNTGGGFYSSIILKSANPDKEKLIAAFYFTIHYWGL